MLNKDEIGNRLKELRKKHQLTTYQLAEKIRLSQSYLSQIENGHKLIPTDVLYDVCVYFNITFDEFFKVDIDTLDIKHKKLLKTLKEYSSEELDALLKFLEIVKEKK